MFWALLRDFNIHTLESRIHFCHTLCVVLYEHTVVVYCVVHKFILRHPFLCQVFELFPGHRRVAFKYTLRCLGFILLNNTLRVAAVVAVLPQGHAVCFKRPG